MQTLCLRPGAGALQRRHDGAVEARLNRAMTRSVLILQFMENDAPAYLGTWLDAHGITSDLRLSAAGAGFPDRIDGYAALAVLGGAMSANDDLPFIHSARRLIEQAMQRNVPVIGHCLGGQLMARALGAPVTASPKPEVGWHQMDCTGSPVTREWFGPAATHRVFHWHYEAFEVPAGAQSLASSAQCPHQAFALDRHLAMQFHVEVDAAKVDLWLDSHDPQYEQAQHGFDSVHPAGRVRHDTEQCLGLQQQLADRIYFRWATLAGLISQ